jgi:RNA polymerase sigma-70 factor (ECF subfamily)
MEGAGTTCVSVGWLGAVVAAAPREGMAMAPVSAEDLGALDDRALVDACRAGRREAFDCLVVRHQRSIYRLCYRFVASHADATDLTQDVFLRAFRAIGGFKGEASVATWLYRIAVNLSLNKVGARAPRTEPVEEWNLPPSAEPDAMSQMLATERAERVRAAVARLPKTQRATLVLRVYQDLSHQEIADVLGSSVSAVKTNFFHALRNLRRLLEKDAR